uniref:T-cell surface glycoprotein CD8 alpha chain isoform X3 n=1 Tax=Doryrhamphus excisus TaxID=161450 RepID=UPI0025AE5E55|nr:T-cell surface glycoprotein CD8 alpha chain isoform X3 [Doryrhamphus excisus]
MPCNVQCSFFYVLVGGWLGGAHMTSRPPVLHRRRHLKMDQRWIYILAMLLFDHGLAEGAGIVFKVKEGEPREIKCKPSESGSMIIWFRVRDTSGVDFIASFSNQGMIKKEGVSYSSIFSASKMSENIMTITSFSQGRDSGLYGCASLKGTQLIFGDVTRLVGEKTEVASKAPLAPTLTAKPPVTSLPCVCETITRKGHDLPCNPIVLIPLAGGCGLLLLILLIVIVYCNQVRTRRCPHHYKRRPRKVATTTTTTTTTAQLITG